MQLRKTGPRDKKMKALATGPHFKERQKRMNVNIWKWLFLGLLSLLFATAVVLSVRLSTVREDVSQLHTSSSKGDVKIGTMTTTRAQLNDTIKVMLTSYHLSNYKLYADNQQMLLEGQLIFWGMTTPFTLTFSQAS